MPVLTGLHHVTAITADPRGNRAFWTGTLGLRMVKRTVNQDDPSAYHLFYADAAGTPGTDMTFFHWPAAPERRGHGAPERTGLRVADAGTLDWWAARLREAGAHPGPIDDRDGWEGFDIEDPEGQRLRLIVDPTAMAVAWDKSPVPPERQLLGLGPVTLAVADPSRTDAFLRGALNMRRAHSHSAGSTTVQVYRMNGEGAGAEVHVAHRPDAPRSRQGAGGVHHVAFRCPDDAALDAWTEHLAGLGIRTSGEIDRFWFRSLYFREPGGTLFEIATDGPGFAVDESPETLGETLSLPPFLESRRAAIEAALPPLD